MRVSLSREWERFQRGGREAVAEESSGTCSGEATRDRPVPCFASAVVDLDAIGSRPVVVFA